MMKRSCLFILLTVLLCLCLCAHADEACLTIPAGTTAIETEAFYGDSSLQTVILPEGILTIGPRAFANSGVTKVNLPQSLTEIADDAFDGCEGIVATVVAGSAGETFVKAQGIEYRYDVVASPVEDFEYEIVDGEVTITGYLGSDTEVVIPSEIEGKPVTVIGYSAFYECTSLVNVTLPNSITWIDDSAFKWCSNLTGITIPESVTGIGNETFTNCSSLTSFHIPNSVSSIGDRAFSYCTSLNNIDIPERITFLSNGLFSHCTNLLRIIIPDSVQHIGANAFEDCTNLSAIYLPKNVSYIGPYAFHRCSSLTEISLPTALTSISASCFQECYKLSSLTIHDTITDIGANAFYRCSNLVDIYIPDSVTSIGRSAFEYCTNLKSITISKNVTSISERCFYYCYNLTDIVIPNSITSIGDYVFYYCRSLKSLDFLPDSIVSIGNHAFSSCAGLCDISLPCNLTGLGSYAFESCSNLSHISVPDSLSVISDGTFKHCDGLISVRLPETIVSIGSHAFYNCKNLDSILITGNVTSIGASAFSYCSKLTIYGETGSYTEEYTTSKGIRFRTSPFPQDIENDIWIDLYGYAHLNTGEPLANAQITIYSDNSITSVASTQTDSYGSWLVKKLLPNSTYRISCQLEPLVFEDIYFTTPATSDVLVEVPSIVANTTEDYLISKQTVLRAEATATTLYLDIISSGSWSAVSNKDWLTLSATAGEAPGDSISVSFEENPDILRVGEIVISTETQSLLIPVVQPGAAGARLPEPTITTPAEDGLELPYDAVEVIWDAVENADYYVVSLRDLTTDTLLLHHEKQAENSGCRALLPAEYFFMGREYRIAVGAVPRGLDSSDPAVGWCERTFKTPAALLATDASISGRICEYEYISEEYDENGNVITQAAIHYLPLSSVTVNLFKITESEKINIGSMVTGEDGAFAFTQCEIGQTYIIELESTDTEFAVLSKEEILSIQERTATTVDLEDAVYSLYTDAGENTTGDITGIPKLGDGHQSWYRSCIAGKPHGLWAEYFQFRDGNKNNAFTGVNKRWQYGYSPYDFKDGQLKAAYQNCYIGEIDFRWTNDSGDRNFDYLVTTNYDGSGSELMIRYLRTKNFAARFNGYLQVPTTDIYTFRLTGDDGINLSLKYAVVEGSTEVLKEYGGKKWHNGFAKSVTTKGMPLSAGSIMPLLIEYYNSDGVAKLKFEYKTQSDNNWRIVPAEWLYMGNNTCLVDGSWITPVQTMAEIDEQVHSAFDSMTDQVLGNYIDKIVTETIKPTVFAKWDDQISETWVQEVICSGYQGVARTAFDLIYSTIVDAALDPSTLTLDQIWKAIVAEIPCVKEYGESYGLDLEEVGEDAFEVVVKVMHIAYEHDPFTYQKLKIKLEDIILYDQMEKSMTGEVASSTLLDKMGTFSTAGKLVDMFHTNYKRAKEELDMNRLRSYIHLTIMENRKSFEQSPPNGPIVNGSNLYQQMICTQIIETASFGGRNSTRPLPDQGSGKYYVSALDNASDFDLYLWFNQYYNRNEVEVMLYKQLLIDTVNMAGEVYGEILP